MGISVGLLKTYSLDILVLSKIVGMEVRFQVPILNII